MFLYFSISGNKLSALVHGWQEIQRQACLWGCSSSGLGKTVVWDLGWWSASLQVTAVTAIMSTFCGSETSLARAAGVGEGEEPALGVDPHPLSPVPKPYSLLFLSPHNSRGGPTRYWLKHLFLWRGPEGRKGNAICHSIFLYAFWIVYQTFSVCSSRCFQNIF